MRRKMSVNGSRIIQAGYCVACCWMLMLLLFAVRVMNHAWAALIAVFAMLAPA